MNHSFSRNIKKRLYYIARSCVKIYLTGNLGPVIEDDEKLTCYVKKSRCKREKYNYMISCHGIRESDQELAKSYKLDEPILYVIDGLKFEKNNVYIFGYDNCLVNIKNCRFNWGLNISVNGKCTLENTFIRSFGRLSIYAMEMVVKNMDIRNVFALIDNNLSIYIGAEKKLDILHSNIGKEKTEILLSSENELNLANSKIAGDEIDCKSKSIIADADSSFIASDKLNITTDNFEQINFTSPLIIYNGDKFESGSESRTLENVYHPLTKNRLELVRILKEIKKECEKLNSEEIDKYKENLVNQPISKVLKR